MLLEEMADDEVAAEDVLRIGKREADKEEEVDSPLPKDPAFLLPRRLDTSSDSGTDTSPPRSFSSAAVHPVHRAPILPLTNCWGASRPPLLPTPSNFPAFGPSLFSLPALSKLALSPPAPCASVAAFTFPDVMGASTRENFSGEVLSNLRRSRNDTECSTTPSISELEARYKWPSTSSPETLSPPKWLPQFPTPPVASLFDICPEVPDEYLTANRIRGKLPTVELQRSHTDLLFFLFYAGHGDRLQLTAASLLFERGWRFNIPNQVWLARWPGITPTEKTPEWEEGLYQYFDHRVWRRIPAHFRLHYSELAEKTNVTAEDVNPISRFRGLFTKV